MLLRLSGLAQASGTPMRMLAIARTTLKNKRASRSQLSQVPQRPLALQSFFKSGRMTGSAPAQGVPTAAVKVVGGSGGGGTRKVGIDCFLCRFSVFFLTFPDFQKAPGAAEAHRFLKNKGPLFGSFFSRRPFGLVKHNGIGTFVFLNFNS